MTDEITVDKFDQYRDDVLTGHRMPLPKDRHLARPTQEEVARYENQEMDGTETLDFFQRLIWSGMLDELSPTYLLAAEALISSKFCKPWEEL